MNTHKTTQLTVTGILLAFACVLCSHSARATTYYGTAGSGTWRGASGPTWSTTSGGPYTVYTSDPTGDIVLEANPYAMTVIGGIDINSLSATVDGYRLNANNASGTIPVFALLTQEDSNPVRRINVSDACTLTIGRGPIALAVGSTLVTPTGWAKEGGGTLVVNWSADPSTTNADVIVRGGTLALSINSGNSTPAGVVTFVSRSISLYAGTTFDASRLGAVPFTLSNWQTLYATNGATATLSGNIILGAAGLVMTNIAGTPTLTVSNGTFTLNGNPVMVSVNNGGRPLGAGSYKIISTVSGGAVAGPLPGSVTVGGDGLAGGLVASLKLTSGELYLVAAGASRNLLWTGAQSTEWSTGTIPGSKNWVLLGGGATDFQNADNAISDNSGGQGGVVSLNGSLLPNNVTFSNTSLAYALGGPGALTASTLTLAGSGAVQFTNSGALTLTALAVQGASLKIGNSADNNLGAVSVTSGMLTLANSGTNAFSSVNLQTGGTLVFNPASDVVVPVALGGGGGNVVKLGVRNLTLAARGTYNGTTTISNGTLALNVAGLANNAGVIPASSAIIVNPGCMLDVANDWNIVSSNNVFLNGGTLTFSSPSGNLDYNYCNNITMDVAPGTVGGSASFLMGRYSLPKVTVAPAASGSTINSGLGLRLNGAINLATFDVADGPQEADLTLNGAMYDATGAAGMGLAKIGAGTLVMTNANTYIGMTTVSNGTLRVLFSLGGPAAVAGGKLQMQGELAGNASVFGGTLELSGNALASVTVSGGDLKGTGTIAGAVTVQSGGTLAPGSGTIGTLTLNNVATGVGDTLSLAGNVRFRINKSGAVLTNDQVKGMTNVIYGGTLTVTATGDALVAGDTFTLFEVAPGGTHQGAFVIFAMPPLAAGLAWDKSGLLTDGTIKVVAGAETPSLFPPPGGYAGATLVHITSSPGATVHYTKDGSNPVTSGTRVSGPSPVTVSVPDNTAAMMIKAYATLSGVADSDVVTGMYSTVTAPSWLNVSGGSWTTPGNWSNNVIANASGVTADFTKLQLFGDTTVTLDYATPTVGHLFFADGWGDPGFYAWRIDSGGGGSLTLNAGTVTPSVSVSNPAVIINVPIGGTNGLAKWGKGTLVLASNNTYAGHSTIREGTLQLGEGGPDGSILGNVTNHSALVFNRTADLTMAGILSGTGGLTNIGAGHVLLLKDNTYTGGTTVSNASGTGGFIAAANNAFGSGVVEINSTGVGRIGLTNNVTITNTFVYNGSANALGHLISLGTSSNTWAGPVIINAAQTGGVGQGHFGTDGGAWLHVSGPILATGAVTTVSLRSGSAVFSGLGSSYAECVFGGTLKAGAANVLPPNATFRQGPSTGATKLELAGFNQTIAGIGAAAASSEGPMATLTLAIPTNTVNSMGNSFAGNLEVNIVSGTLQYNGNSATSIGGIIASGGALGGNGVIACPIQIRPGGTLAPGTATIGNLTTGDLALQGDMFVKVNTSVSPSNDFVNVVGVLTSGGTGTLTVTNEGPELVLGNSFKLFNKPVPSGGFLRITPAPGAGLAWANKLGIDGMIEVVAESSVATNPIAVKFGVNGNQLVLGWPADHTGWRLEVQPNSLNVGLSGTWHNVAGSSMTNWMAFPVDTAAPTVFYRLVYP